MGISDVGPVAMDNFTSLGLPGQARVYRCAGDFTLGANQSLWGWGGSLAKLEITGHAVFEPGSLVNVSARGRIGGAGGGDGGLPPTGPAITYRDTRPTLPYAVGQGGTATALATAGEAGQRAGAYLAGQTTPLGEQAYASALGGGTGGPGQGDQYLLGLSGVLSSTTTGGAPVPFSGVVPSTATGGAGGAGSPGTRGGNGQPGVNGGQGTNGANGRLETLAGTGRNLRGGSGGGAGGTGGSGVGGGTGGSGGGGAFGVPSPFDINPPVGGSGGQPGGGGGGGTGGMGGAGGGGGGGFQVLVWGNMTNGARFEAIGGDGQAGNAGTTGIAGTAGAGGAPGTGNGGGGGDGGNGGRGGDGGTGGAGSGGAGGNVQIAAGTYTANGATFFTQGGAGAPAGLAQIHSFNGPGQNQPFGTFAAATNPWRSYVRPTSGPITPLPAMDPAFTPYIPIFPSGPAVSGFLTRTVQQQLDLLDDLLPPTGSYAAIFRLPASDFGMSFPDYDVVVASLLAGPPTSYPGFRAVSPADAATQPFGFEGVILAVTLLGPAGVTFQPSTWWMTLVEKTKPFEVTGQIQSPLSNDLREFRGTPLTSPGIPLQDVVFLTEKGTPRYSLAYAAEYSDSQPLGFAVQGQTFTTYRYVRVGSSPQVDFSIVSDPGSPFSSFTGTVDTLIHRQSMAPLAGPTLRFGPMEVATPPATVSVTGTTELRTQNTIENLVSAIFHPVLDSLDRQVRIDVQSRLVGPSPRLPLAIRSGDPLAVVQPDPGVTGSVELPLENVASVQASWAVEMASLPHLTDLSIVAARIEGPNAAAFTFGEPLPAVIARGVVGELAVLFTPPTAGEYRATLILTTDLGAAFGQPGSELSVPCSASAAATPSGRWPCPPASATSPRTATATAS